TGRSHHHGDARHDRMAIDAPGRGREQGRPSGALSRPPRALEGGIRRVGLTACGAAAYGCPVRKPSGFAAIVLASSLLFVPGPGTSVRPARAGTRPRRPDVILILTDDERVRTLDWMPHVERQVVEKGKLFTNAMIPTSVCCPSRASILTGLFAHSTKVWS